MIHPDKPHNVFENNGVLLFRLRYAGARGYHREAGKED